MGTKNIVVVVGARLNSTRVPRKMIAPFAGTTLLNIAIEKLLKCESFGRDQIFVSVHEKELCDIAERYPVNIFRRSRESANEADLPVKLYEWWNKLPEKFTHFVLLNPCLPLLSPTTIDSFVRAFRKSSGDSMFGVVERKNFIFMDGVMINHFKHFPPPHNRIMNTIVIPPWHEAAHCLYAGRLSKIPDPDYLGSFDVKGSPELFVIPEEEFFDIDYPWQFDMVEKLYAASRPKLEFEIVPGRMVGPNHPTFIIAEIGCNHQGNVDTAKELIRKASLAGVDAIKFQKRTMGEFMTDTQLDQIYDSTHSFGKTYRQHRQHLELSADQLKELFDYAKAVGLIAFASVWDETACKEMENIGMPIFKVASADLRSDPLLRVISATEKSIIISTGMGEASEVQHALDVINRPCILMQCTSTYPCRADDINLDVIPKYIQDHGHRAVVGYSGHESGIATTLAAVAVGARVIERHFTLDKSAKGSDHAASLTPDEMSNLVAGIRQIEKTIGSSIKKCLPSEISAKLKLAKSLVFARDMTKGARLSSTDIAYKSPGGGISPSRLNEFIGLELKCSVAKDQLVDDKYFI